MEDGHYGVVEELDGVLVERPWRVEREGSGYRLNHADDASETARALALREFAMPERAIKINFREVYRTSS